MNRTSAKGQKLARQAKARTIKRADLRKVAFDVIINATPVGMGNTHDCPLKDQEIQARVVFDMVYDPVETHLVQVARAKGIAVIPGIEMFVQQAARQFEIWTGKPAPAGDMLRAVTIALQERAAAKSRRRTEQGCGDLHPEGAKVGVQRLSFSNLIPAVRIGT